MGQTNLSTKIFLGTCQAKDQTTPQQSVQMAVYPFQDQRRSRSPRKGRHGCILLSQISQHVPENLCSDDHHYHAHLNTAKRHAGKRNQHYRRRDLQYHGTGYFGLVKCFASKDQQILGAFDLGSRGRGLGLLYVSPRIEPLHRQARRVHKQLGSQIESIKHNCSHPGHSRKSLQ